MLLAVLLAPAAARADVKLLNVSYDPTRELYQAVNAAFAQKWEAAKHEKVTINQSHGGSGKQARAVIDGLPADVVTLGLAYDIDAIAEKSGLLPKNWQSRLPDNSTPYTSTVVFVVRKGNPKQIKDWDDLVKPGVAVITSNPKTSGGGRWSYVGAWGWAYERSKHDEQQANDFIARLYRNVPVLDSGARGSTITFSQRNVGDVLICWENEAHLLAKQPGGDGYQIITPSLTVLAEPPVALVDQNVDQHGTRAAAQAYLEFLYSPEGQEIAARNFYRPRSPSVAKKYAAQLAPVKTFTIEQMGGWQKTQAKHFNDGGVFDQIYSKGR
jgi:sulfate transport system substrate-binding protein